MKRVKGDRFIMRSGNPHHTFEGREVVFDNYIPFNKAYVMDDITGHRFVVDVEWITERVS